MRKTIIVISTVMMSLSALNSFAQNASQLKEMSMKACEAQAFEVEESQRELVIKICECTVENTDYESLIAKSAAGDASAQDDAIAVAKKCQKENS